MLRSFHLIHGFSQSKHIVSSSVKPRKLLHKSRPDGLTCRLFIIWFYIKCFVLQTTWFKKVRLYCSKPSHCNHERVSGCAALLFSRSTYFAACTSAVSPLRFVLVRRCVRHREFVGCWHSVAVQRCCLVSVWPFLSAWRCLFHHLSRCLTTLVSATSASPPSLPSALPSLRLLELADCSAFLLWPLTPPPLHTHDPNFPVLPSVLKRQQFYTSSSIHWSRFFFFLFKAVERRLYKFFCGSGGKKITKQYCITATQHARVCR